MAGTPYFDIEKQDGDSAYLILRGVWRIGTLAEIDKALSRILKSGRHITLDGQNISRFDTSAAWYLADLGKRGFKINLKNFSRTRQQMYRLAGDLEDVPPVAPKHSPIRGQVRLLGQKGMRGFHNLAAILSMLGELVFAGKHILQGREHFRLRSVVFHLNEVGYKALPVIILMAFSIALVMGYQGATQLQNFGAAIYTIDLVVISVLREMGVLLTSIMVAGRTGSAFAAQLGTMQLNEEIDALRTMGVSPFNTLILPRLIAIVIALPILTFIANMVGLFGMYVYGAYAMDITQAQFLSRLGTVITPEHFWSGMIKSPVFALIIGTVACLQGLQVRNSAEDVGRHTTAAVVQSIFLIIIADALFSILFTRLEI